MSGEVGMIDDGSVAMSDEGCVKLKEDGQPCPDCGGSGTGPCNCCLSLTVTIHSVVLFNMDFVLDLVLDNSLDMSSGSPVWNCYYNNPPMVVDRFTPTGAWRILYFGTVWTQNTVTDCPSTNVADWTKTLVGSIPDMTLTSIVCND